MHRWRGCDCVIMTERTFLSSKRSEEKKNVKGKKQYDGTETEVEGHDHNHLIVLEGWSEYPSVGKLWGFPDSHLPDSRHDHLAHDAVFSFVSSVV